MKTLITIAPLRVGGLDMLLPVFIKIKEAAPSTNIILVFLEISTYDELKKNPFLYGRYIAVVNSIVFLKKEQFRKSIKGTFTVGLNLSKFLLKLLLAPDVVVFQSRGLESPLMKMISYIVRKKRGRIYEHSNSLGFFDERKLKTKFTPDKCDGHICFSSDDVKYLKLEGKKKIHPIGYPRLYRDWKDLVIKVSKNELETESARLGLSLDARFVSVFLGSTVEGLFDLDELEQWIEVVLESIRSRLNDDIILIKPHPMQNMEHLEICLKKLNYKNVAITFLHPCVLSVGSKLVITHHTSTVVDAMAFKAPTIQFIRLTQKWLKRHPEESSFIKLGVLWAENEEEFAERIDEALSAEYSPPDIERGLRHKEDISFLIG